MDDSAPLPPPPAPPYNPPPVIIPPAPVSPRRGGRGWMIFALILLVLLGFSMLSNFGHYASNLMRGKPVSARASGPRLEEVLTEDNEAFDKIAVIDIAGIITSRTSEQGGYNMVDIIRAQLKRADDDNRVKAVI
ncbi:MAG TPA: hypothetical protein VN794_00180, partial [Methylomirabilota bacterium]|nr:hypothetical protein [Methylomirabilota bacterium]